MVEAVARGKVAPVSSDEAACVRTLGGARLRFPLLQQGAAISGLMQRSLDT